MSGAAAGRDGPRACARPCGGGLGPVRAALGPASPRGARSARGLRSSRRAPTHAVAAGAEKRLREGRSAAPGSAAAGSALSRRDSGLPQRRNRRRCAAGTGPGLCAAQRRAHGLGERSEAGARSGSGLYVRPCPAGAAERELRTDVRARRAGATPSTGVVRFLTDCCGDRRAERGGFGVGMKGAPRGRPGRSGPRTGPGRAPCAANEAERVSFPVASPCLPTPGLCGTRV